MAPGARRAFLGLTAATLAGCGGGIYFEWSPGSDPPSVSMTVSPTTAAAGQAVTLSASASDDDYVDSVAFYRIDPSGSTVFLGTDWNEPWQLGAVIPAATASGQTVHFFARATDSWGQQSDSALVAVTVP